MGIGAEARDLGETFALAREGGLSAEERIKLKALQDKVDPKIDLGTLLTREKAILKGVEGGKYVVRTEDGLGTRILESPEQKAAMLKELNRIIAEEFDGPNALDKQSQKIVLSLKEKYERSSAKKENKITINDVIQSKKKARQN